MNCNGTTSQFVQLLHKLQQSQESICVFSICVEPFVGKIASVESDYISLLKADIDEDGNTKISKLHIQLALIGGIEVTESIINKEGKENENSNVV